jgi:acyl-CoA synthetase (AMP-forming)/AMP-acid ligase II
VDRLKDLIIRNGFNVYPREVRVVDAVPLTSVMKTDRKALRALVTPG